MQSKTPVPEAPDVDRVRLKPFLGMQPRIWLPSLYLILVAAAAFFLFFWPGLVHPGTRVSVDSTPQGAAVLWDGKLYGQTPLEGFFPQGKGILEIKKPGFKSYRSEFTSGNSVLMSLFFPKKARVQIALQPVSQEAVLSIFRSNLAKWSAAAPFSVVYRFPPLFTRFREDARAAGFSDDQIRSELIAERRFVVDPQMYDDYGTALELWKGVPTENFEAQYKLWEKALGSSASPDGRLVFLWVLANQEKTVRDRLSDSPSAFVETNLKKLLDSLALQTVQAVNNSPLISFSGFRFQPIPSGTFAWGYEKPKQGIPVDPPFGLPCLRSVKKFWLAEHETTQAQFARFVQSQPEWSPFNRATLVKKGLVTPDYLASWTTSNPPSPSSSVSEVSWYAAEAYVGWLNSSGQVPKGKKAVLPNEVQWEWAAREAKIDFSPVYKKNSPNALGLWNMQDGVWEWTSSSWAPGDQLVNADPITENDPSWFRTLKGGCDANAGQVKIWERGVGNPSTCNAVTGFRVALISNP